jgi:hypothetical protein
MNFKPQWAGIGFGRSRLAHFWRASEAMPYFVRTSCGKTLLPYQLCSGVDLRKCKHCEKAEKS